MGSTEKKEFRILRLKSPPKLATTIEKKAQEQFRIGRMKSLPKLIIKLKMTNEKKHGWSSDYKVDSPRSHSFHDSYWENKASKKVIKSSMSKSHWKAKCSAFDEEMPEEMKDRINSTKAEIKSNINLLKAI